MSDNIEHVLVPEAEPVVPEVETPTPEVIVDPLPIVSSGEPTVPADTVPEVPETPVTPPMTDTPNAG